MPPSILSYLEQQPPFGRLRQKYAENPSGYIIVIGAGPSTTAFRKHNPQKTLPTWNALISDLKSELFNPAIRSSLDKTIVDVFNDIDSAADPWKQISKISKYLQPTLFNATVSNILEPDLSRIPRAYEYLWKLKPNGILTLNLDDLAKRGRDPINVLDGTTAAQSAHIFSSETPFVINLHGTYDKPASYILTSEQRDTLLNNENYLNTLRYFFMRFKVIFYGVTLDDVAISGPLAQLNSLSVHPNGRVWIVKSVDKRIRETADRLGAEIVQFPPEIEWDSSLEVFVDNLTTYRAIEPVVSPILDAGGTENEHVRILSPDEIVRLEPDGIRKEFAKINRSMFQDAGGFNYDRFRIFCQKYDNAMQLAARLNPKTSNNFWLGNRVNSELGKGTFGRVYAGETPDHKAVAIKIARSEVRDDDIMLESFRRGVASMQFLSRELIDGTVKLIGASELPPAIIMEYVDGINLQELVTQKLMKSSLERASLVLKIAIIINKCHNMSDAVLHRDLRPANIIVGGDVYHADAIGHVDVTVLDFDLSWHVGAQGRDYVMTVGEIGFLAPEQLEKDTDGNPRHQAVDVFGIGILLYFCISGEYPGTNVTAQARWSELIYNNLTPCFSSKWKCARRFCSSLILSATRYNQSDRISLSRLIEECNILLALLKNEEVFGVRILMLEVNERAFQGTASEAKRNFFLVTLPTGVQISFELNEVNNFVSIRFIYTQREFQNRRNVSEYIRKRSAELLQVGSKFLRKSGHSEDRLGGFVVTFSNIKLNNLNDVNAITVFLDETTKVLRID